MSQFSENLTKLCLIHHLKMQSCKHFLPRHAQPPKLGRENIYKMYIITVVAPSFFGDAFQGH